MESVRSWDLLVEEGRKAVIAQENINWVIGDLACEIETGYGENTLAKYAEEIGINYGTLKYCCATSKAWSQKVLRSTNWSAHKALNAHPQREQIVGENPNITAREASEKMREYQAAHGSEKAARKIEEAARHKEEIEARKAEAAQKREAKKAEEEKAKAERERARAEVKALREAKEAERKAEAEARESFRREKRVPQYEEFADKTVSALFRDIHKHDHGMQAIIQDSEYLTDYRRKNIVDTLTRLGEALLYWANAIKEGKKESTIKDVTLPTKFLGYTQH